MGPLSLLLLALGLSLDALAVSVALACGLGARLRRGDVLRLGLWFGGFQAAMPIAGWAAGSAARQAVAAFDHWIAFGLLAAIGVRMAAEGIRNRGRVCEHRPLRWPLLLGLAVATSIDALVAGVGISMIGSPIGMPAATIGGVTAVLCWGGALLASRVEPWLRGNAEILGGLFLVGLGIKTLVEHLG